MVPMIAAVLQIFVDSLEIIRTAGFTFIILPLPWVAAKMAAVITATCRTLMSGAERCGSAFVTSAAWVLTSGALPDDEPVK